MEAYKKEDRKIKKLVTSSIFPLSLTSLLIRVRRERIRRKEDFKREKEEYILKIREIEEREKTYCDELEELEKEINQKLLTMKREGLIIDSIIERDGGKIVFAEISHIETPLERKKVYRDSVDYNTIPDRFFMLDVPKAKKAVEGGLPLPSFNKEEKTVIRVFTGD